MVSGDAHFSYVCDLPDDPLNPTTYNPATGAGSHSIEFLVPSASSAAVCESGGWPPRTASIPLEEGLVADNPHCRYAELDSKGYTLLDFAADAMTAEYWFVPHVKAEVPGEFRAATFSSTAGSNHVTRVPRADEVGADGPVDAPSLPGGTTPTGPTGPTPTLPEESLPALAAVAAVAGGALVAWRRRGSRPAAD